ncbi:MAG TPA: hypothetical protein PLO16_12650 [Acidocella sp.]|nr:hypothetical protein [Acidocella sp.]
MAKKGWVAKDKFKPGGEKGKLHRELGVPSDKPIPHTRLLAAIRSSNPEIRRDAIRAKTMEGWNHSRRSKLYDRSK